MPVPDPRPPRRAIRLDYEATGETSKWTYVLSAAPKKLESDEQAGAPIYNNWRLHLSALSRGDLAGEYRMLCKMRAVAMQSKEMHRAAWSAKPRRNRVDGSRHSILHAHGLKYPDFSGKLARHFEDKPTSHS